MIYWFTGQPGAGKTVLANKLSYFMVGYTHQLAFPIDGDQMRDLFVNKDYSIKGRVANIDAAQKISHYLHNENKLVIVSLVSPYLDQREEFKQLIGTDIMEIYVHTSNIRGREQYHVKGYQPPVNNFIDVDTTIDTPKESLQKIITQIKK
jgi:adenylylsulfate kinase|tara:strand:- start:774 stop:1223 length:450 start_codon:yes stop_codon:yes gene_type:complete